MNKFKSNKLVFKNEKNIFLLSIILSSLIIKIIFIPTDFPVKLDAIDYFSFGIELSKTWTFPIGILNTNDGWSIFLSPIFSIIGYSDFMNLIYSQRLTSVILSSLTIIPIYLLCRQFTSSNFSLIGVSIFAFHPMIIENSILGISESLYIFLISVTLYSIFSKNNKLLYSSFFLTSFLSIVRYEGLILFIPLTIVFFLRFTNSKKNFLKFPILIGISLLIILSIGNLRSSDNGIDGFQSHLFSGLSFLNCSINCLTDANESEYEIMNSKNFLNSSIFNTIKFLAWVSIPFYLILIPLGIVQLVKTQRKDFVYLILFAFFLLVPALYAYGRELSEIRYLFVLFPIFSVFTSNFFTFNTKFENSKWILLIILIIFSFSIFFLNSYLDDYEYEREIYVVTKFLINNGNGSNNYPGNEYVKVATLESLWPNPLPLKETGRTDYYFKKIPYDEYKTLEDFLKNSREKGLTHLIILKNNEVDFLNPIFYNYSNYPYLIKVFDSDDLNFKNKILIFKIDYEIFNELNYKIT